MILLTVDSASLTPRFTYATVTTETAQLKTGPVVVEWHARIKQGVAPCF